MSDASVPRDDKPGAYAPIAPCGSLRRVHRRVLQACKGTFLWCTCPQAHSVRMVETGL